MNIRKTLIAALTFLVVALPAMAQTTTYQTSTAAAVAQGATTLSVASATNLSASTQTQERYMFVQDGAGQSGEWMKIISVNGTTVGVQRGQGGTVPQSHVSGAVVFHGPTGSSAGGIGTPFTNVSPQLEATCTAAQFAYLPIVNYQTGSVWYCRNSRWTSGTAGVGTATSGAVTATLGDYILGYTAIAGASTVTLPTPVAGMRGKVYIIKNQSGFGTHTIWVTGVQGTSDAVVGAAAATYPVGRYYTDGSSWYAW